MDNNTLNFGFYLIKSQKIKMDEDKSKNESEEILITNTNDIPIIEKKEEGWHFGCV